MPNRWMKSILLVITYTVLLVLAIVKIDGIFGVAGQVLYSCRPLFIGFAIAFVLNRPCTFFCKNYERNLGQRYQKLGRPLAVLTSYLVLIAVMVALFSFVLPQVAASIQTLAYSLNGYIANLQQIINSIASYLDLEALDLSGLKTFLNDFLKNMPLGKPVIKMYKK